MTRAQEGLRPPRPRHEPLALLGRVPRRPPVGSDGRLVHRRLTQRVAALHPQLAAAGVAAGGGGEREAIALRGPGPNPGDVGGGRPRPGRGLRAPRPLPPPRARRRRGGPALPPGAAGAPPPARPRGRVPRGRALAARLRAVFGGGRETYARARGAAPGTRGEH